MRDRLDAQVYKREAAMSGQDNANRLTVPASEFSVDQERERLHRQIFSSVSHDLKTPLASIIGSLEIFERMSDRLSNEQRQSLMNVALQEAYRLDNFITNILDMAKLENRIVKMQREQILIGTLLENCVVRLGYRLKESDVHIETPGQALSANLDMTLLTRAVCLILDNAVKYGGKPVSIQIAYGKSDDGTGFIRITDNGPGIPPGQLEKVFEKYTRFARGDQQNAGTGLGLSICREIMQLLEGTVGAANSEKGGAIFTLRFPSN